MKFEVVKQTFKKVDIAIITVTEAHYIWELETIMGTIQLIPTIKYNDSKVFWTVELKILPDFIASGIKSLKEAQEIALKYHEDAVQKVFKFIKVIK